MKKICVFCGSSSGRGKEYSEFAFKFGEQLAKNNFGVVYGGGSIGLMGNLADGALAAGGKVWGVIPQSLVDREFAHKKLTKQYVSANMHERKHKMYDLADAFVALPGGIGTLDEFCEISTWRQLEFHKKPHYILNFNGFYDHFIKHLMVTHAEGFLRDQDIENSQIVSNTEDLIKAIKRDL